MADRIIAVRTGKTVYRDGDTAVKVFDADYAKPDILSEALNQARVEDIGINVPKVIEVKTIDGKWAIVSEYIAGKTLAQLMEENPKEKDEYLEQFVDLQMKVHAAKCPVLNKLKDKMNMKISTAELDATTRYELHTRLSSMPKHDKVLHGDFNPSNIIVDSKGKFYILDWSHATQGNASADAATTYLLFVLKDQKLADLYLDTFCEMSDTAKQYVQRWLPITAASRLGKKIQGERALLESWLDVVEYE